MVDTIGSVVYGRGEVWIEPAIVLDAVLVMFEKGAPEDPARAISKDSCPVS